MKGDRKLGCNNYAGDMGRRERMAKSEGEATARFCLKMSIGKEKE